MDYIYFFANANLTLRVIDYLDSTTHLSTSCTTVIHCLDGWVIRIKFDSHLTPQLERNFITFMRELGEELEPLIDLEVVFWSLEIGQSTIEVMRRHQVAIVSHGHSNRDDVQAFCDNCRSQLGYCP